MVARTHAFFLKSVKTKIANARAEYLAAVDEKETSIVVLKLRGYSGFTSSPSHSKVVRLLVQTSLSMGIRQELVAQQPSPIAARHADDPRALYTDRSIVCAMFHEIDDGHDAVRLIHRGELKVLQREPWISIIHSRAEWSRTHGGPPDRKSGFAGYMLTHKPTQEGWETFLSKLYADLDQSGQGVEGYDTVEQSMDIHWIHGENHGIPQDDVEAARR
ncbi:hypothetical protein BU23DRAFT_563379 [Bimuria novae-zelandiae CBS 107.79]|uniref:Uncharacterized protein n=1 Tax=Bimuria novae-zelandiae CBS 107.79 TaxID=1447943 RepID=A0A6A5VRE7_9PLEO|nr:hypothetical protein BU23DRAFT_563379 [Bimuria novae-zelandiae CBS 107.79]